MNQISFKRHTTLVHGVNLRVINWSNFAQNFESLWVDYLQFCVSAEKFIAAATVRTMRFISNLLITIWFRRDPDLLEYMSSGFQSLKKLCQRYYMSFGEVPLESLEKKSCRTSTHGPLCLPPRNLIGRLYEN